VLQQHYASRGSNDFFRTSIKVHFSPVDSFGIHKGQQLILSASIKVSVDCFLLSKMVADDFQMLADSLLIF